jgi:hypothetical protein
VHEVALVPEGRIAPARLPEDAELADDLDPEPGLLEELTLRRVLDGFTGLDSASGHHPRIVGLVDGVEDEQLVGSGGRVLARDVDDDSRPDVQFGWARIFAL